MKWIALLGLCAVTAACAGRMKYDRVEDLKKIDEFDQKVQISLGEEDPAESAGVDEGGASVNQTGSAESKKQKEAQPKDRTEAQPKKPSEAQPKDGKKSKSKTAKTADGKSASTKSDVKSTTAKSTTGVSTGASTAGKKTSGKGKASEVKAEAKGSRRLPDIEDNEGFDGRRPIQDPWRVGEKIVHSVTYYGVSAGTLILEVKPFAQVNGRKSYNFRFQINTSTLFSSFYFVDDYANALVDFETLVPSVYTLHVKESRQLRETRMLFEKEDGKEYANFWEKKVTERDGEEEKKVRWEILDHSQNVFSAVQYTRVFQWRDGVEYAFRVADSEENNVFKGKVVRREKLSTAVGEFDAVVIRPEVELKGKLKPVGENLIWLSDDDRRFILRIESKIRIGTLVSEITHLDRGRE